MSNYTIPVLSLNELREDRESFTKKVGNALEKVGFFALTDHGINKHLIEGAYEASEKFFNLPLEDKMKYHLNNMGQRGYTPCGLEAAKGSDLGDNKEFFHVGQLESIVHPKNIYPVEVPKFEYLTRMLYGELESLGGVILESISEYLGKDGSFLKDSIKGGNTILRQLYYPAITGEVKNIRAAAHEDINLITLLFESTAPGLELLQTDGTWLRVHRLEGQIIVNSSDMLHNISNGILRSTTHRVVNPDKEDKSARLSMPCFIHPISDFDLSPLQSCIDKVGEKRTRDIKAGDFLLERLKELGL